MSLSVCVRNVRATSKGGNITEGSMKCEDIDTLKSVGYTIEYLDEPTQVDSTASSFEAEQEIEEIIQEEIIQEPIVEQIETVIIQEPEVQTLVIQQQDIFDNSLVLAETNATLKANNIELTNKVSILEQELTTVTTQEELNKILLEKEIEKVHTSISNSKNYVGNHPKTQGREIEFNKWINSVKNAELELEKFANKLGLNYTRRSSVSGQIIYYQEPPIEEWESYIPTSSATVGSKF
jgi:hypothetical protein